MSGPPGEAADTQDDAIVLVWPHEAACAETAQRLAALLMSHLRNGANLLVTLYGELGAGKTTFTRHLLRSLGVEGRIKSPSFAVVEPHEAAGVALWHFDFYRFADPREWEDAGFRDIFGAPGLKLVEWPDKAPGLLPVADLSLHLSTLEGDARSTRWVAGTALGAQCLHALAAQALGANA